MLLDESHCEGLNLKNICNVRYLYGVCFIEVSSLKKFINDVEEFKSDFKSITAKADKMMEIAAQKLENVKKLTTKSVQKI
ncbi:hypothetical protein E2C01_089636 [Portunus trituberculatus]|uniref:Uncharacterized protein n=1 Tax=Portunus trituberculatus TaxID=210409 RepID=A0A5B7JIS6_PORTR|nr:hypothetical protein [Portunus trituberculatus]